MLQGTTFATRSHMAMKWFRFGLLLTGLSAAACSGKSTQGAATEPSAAGSTASDDSNGSGASAGTAPNDVTNEPSSNESLDQYCSHVDCPASPQAVTPVCTSCPDDAVGNCQTNIYGGTERYASSCGGVTFLVHMGFDARVWHFDANGQLVGASFSSDTSGPRQYGRECGRTELTVDDLCAQLGGSGRTR